MSKLKHMLQLQLNSIEDNELNPTLKKAVFSILDLEVSGNKQQIDKDTLDKAIKQINHLPIYADYLPVSEGGANDDNFTDHSAILDVDRQGEEFITTSTLVIGHFISDGRYEDIDGKTVVIADAVLYADKYPNQIELLQELLNSGIKINTSCEYYYSKENTEIIDGIEYISGDIIFIGHTILGSNPEGQGGIVDGAYESSNMVSMNKKIEWNKSLNKVINELNNSVNENNNKEGESMEKIYEIIMNALSHEDISWKLYDELQKGQTVSEWFDSYIYETYNESFVLKVWGENYSNAKFYEYQYSQTDDEVIIDFESRKEIKRDWVEVQNQLAEAQNNLEKVQNELKISNESLIVEQHNKKQVEESLKEANDKIVSINSRLEELSEIEKQYNEEQKEKALNARKSEFEPKFKKVNALTVFESEEVQKMISDSLEDESIIASLNSMIVDLIPEIPEKPVQKAENKKEEDLLPTSGLSKSSNDLLDLKEGNKSYLGKYLIED